MTTTTLTPNPAPNSTKRSLRRSIGVLIATVIAATVLTTASAGTAGALTALEPLTISNGGVYGCTPFPHRSLGNWVSWGALDTTRNGYYNVMELVTSAATMLVVDRDSDGRVDQLWIWADGGLNGWFDNNEDGTFDTMYGSCGTRPIRRTITGGRSCYFQVACIDPGKVSSLEQVARWADYWFIGNRVR